VAIKPTNAAPDKTHRMRNNQKEKKCHHGRNANDEKVKKKANPNVKSKVL
jgi:hypothetical protein